MTPLNPLNISLSGAHLIEASAGTGKTYTITGLYVRLLLEKELKTENILVVTYTEAACQELREGIRSRLAEALAVFQEQKVGDTFLQGLFLKYQEQNRDMARMKSMLTLALMEFDLAAVYTIHGFCMRVLQDSAFESGFLFETEFVENDNHLLQTAIDDYWRCHQGIWHPLFLAFQYYSGRSPDSVIKIIGMLYKTVLAGGEQVLLHKAKNSSGYCDQRLLDSLAKLWGSERQNIIELLGSPALNNTVNGYNPANVKRWCATIDRYFEQAEGNPIEALKSLGSNALIAGTKKSKIGETPEHAFFSKCQDLMDQLQRADHQLLCDLTRYCLQELPVLKLKAGQISFDDLLTGVRDGLQNPETGKQLCFRIARQYPAALIDEFQDTDPIQYTIFSTVFLQEKEKSLFLVGDPKQAIYGFRGADIFAYLTAARSNIDEEHTLGVNWRSEPGLIKACNAFFAGHARPFVLQGIDFNAVGSSEKVCKELKIMCPDDAPLTIFTFDDQENRVKAKARTAQWTAAAIADLLSMALSGNISFEQAGEDFPEQLSAGDIAVLVRNHREGKLVKEALRDVGVHAVIHSRESVYNTIEARELSLLLHAVAHPIDQKRVKAALATRLMGVSAADLQAFEDDESAWENILNRFAEYNRRWLDRGIAAMLYWLMSREEIYARLSEQHQGERRLTNLRHLVELLQEADHAESFGMDRFLDWFNEKRHDGGESDASQIRLESDENLLKIVTIHKSKGLQYPIVFCPFAWDSSFLSNTKSGPVSYHDRFGNLQVDLGTDSQEQSKLAEEKERLAEEIRLLYVAMTRAIHRCYIFWGRVRSGRNKWATATSALQYVLNCQEYDTDVITGLNTCFGEADYDALMQQMRKLVASSEGTVMLRSIDSICMENAAFLPEKEEHQEARKFIRKINHNLGIRSFSSLHSGGQSEEPDYDDGEQTELQVVLPDGHHPRSPFTFPRGSQAGSCLHAILELYDFQEHDQFLAETLVQEKLQGFGFDLEWTATVLQLLHNITHTKLGGTAKELTLCMLNHRNRLDEVEFYYTVPGIGDPEIRQIFSDIIGQKETSPTLPPYNGFMKGFIDLVFKWQDRYYIADYKSNYLGMHIEDYSQERLAKAIHSSGYDLQYHIYTLALHRYLGLRMQDYDYEAHFGGVYYLFLRGMHPTKDASGVFFHRPDRPTIEKLDGTCC